MLLTRKSFPHPPPPGDFQSSDQFGRKRWRQVQYLAEQFWTRWKREYLPTLQQRQKWHRDCPPLAVNDIILVNDKILPRNEWIMGRIKELTSTRAIISCTKSKVIERAINDIVFLFRPEV